MNNKWNQITFPAFFASSNGSSSGEYDINSGVDGEDLSLSSILNYRPEMP